MTEKPADLEALKACKLGDFTVQDAVTERSGVTGEKMEALVRMKLNHSISPLDNPLQIKVARKTIARLATRSEEHTSELQSLFAIS